MKSAYSSFLELIKDFFKNPALRRPLLISVILHASQQITGIGAVRIIIAPARTSILFSFFRFFSTALVYSVMQVLTKVMLLLPLLV